MMNFITEFVLYVPLCYLNYLFYIDSIQSKNPFNKIFLLTGEKFILHVNKNFPHADRKNESMIKIWILYGFFLSTYLNFCYRFELHNDSMT